MKFVNFIPFIVFSLLFLLNRRRVGKNWTMSNYILLLYMFSTFSFFALSILKRGFDVYWNAEALILTTIPTFILLYPLSRMESIIYKKKYKLEDIKFEKLRYLSWFLIVISFVSILFFLQNIRQLFVIDIVELRSGYGGLYKGGTLISKISCLGAYLFPVTLFVYFYNLVKKQLPNYITKLLLISSLSFIIYTLNVAGRDGIVLWFLYYIGYFSFFKNYMDENVSKTIFKTIFIAAILALPIFLYISSSRFSDDSSGIGGSIISYSGQSLNNLSHNIDAFHSSDYGNIGARGQFEVLYRIMDIIGGSSEHRVNRFENAAENSIFLQNLGYKPFSFSYYIGSLYPLHVSIWGLLAFIGVFYIVCFRYTKIKNKKVSTKHLICSFSWYTILMSGLFYFYNGTYIGNFFLLITLFIPLIL